jgi:D-2-hydroxyglutarate dehydrogenase
MATLLALSSLRPRLQLCLSTRSLLRRASTSSPSRATPADLAALRAIVGDAYVLEGASEDAAPFQLDWLRQYPGRCAAVVRPRDTAQVAAVLRLCDARGLGVVPQGGNTGLVGGGVPRAAAPARADEVVLSLARLNAIESFDEDAGVVVCGAGTVLQALDAFLAERGCMVPLDLGSKGSCQIGGNVSTNAGGLRLLRYGSLHGSVLGLEVATARGEVLDMMSTLRKDNVGFDLKQLFVGSEGALGVVTKVSPASLPALPHGFPSPAPCHTPRSPSPSPRCPRTRPSRWPACRPSPPCPGSCAACARRP